MTRNDNLRAALHIERAMESRTGNFGKPITTMFDVQPDGIGWKITSPIVTIDD